MHKVSPAKKKSYTSNWPKKKFLQTENPPPPLPPHPHHYSNGVALNIEFPAHFFLIAKKLFTNIVTYANDQLLNDSNNSIRNK